MSKPAPGKNAPALRKAPQAAASARPAVSDHETLPDAAAMERMLAPVRAFAADAERARVRGFLERLSVNPPQVLLLEGGTAEDRLAAAHYWMTLLNCGNRPAASAMEPARIRALPGSGPAREGDEPVHEAAGEIRQPAPAREGAPGLSAGAGPEVPCFDCPVCRAMVAHLHRDCFFLDGASGSIKIDDVRALRSVLGEPPREARRRVVLFREAQALGEAAANSLLKSFEDPRPDTSFMLLVPQRERLLPTLVSRGMVLTLPWPLEEDAAVREALAPWEAALCTFLRSGRDFFERSGSRGALDAPLAHALSALCRRSLLRCIKARKEGSVPREGLESILARLPEARMRMLDEALAECQDSLLYGVNPTLVVEWLVTRMYLLLPGR